MHQREAQRARPANRKVRIMANENRKSTVKGIIANTEKQTFENFEIETPYTRSNSMAIKYAKEAMKLDDNALVSIVEIINKPFKRPIYDAGKLIENAIEFFDDETDAKNAASDSVSVIKVTDYVYSGQVWAILDSGEYYTEFIKDASPVKFGKVDTRGFIKMRAEKRLSGKVIGVHGDKREVRFQFITIENDALEKCVKND